MRVAHIAFALMLALLSLNDGDEAGAAPVIEPLRIGYIGALTGDAAMIGTEIARSLQASIAEINKSGGINGRSVELLTQDDGYVVARALSAYEKLRLEVNSGVIFMSTYGGLFALGKRPEADGVVIVDTLDCNDALVRTSAMHTCVATRTESIGEGFLHTIRQRGGGKVGVLYEEEAWFNFIVDTLRSELKSALVEVVAPVSAPDYRAEIAKLRSAKVEHIVFLGNDSMGRALAEARRTGIKAPFYSIAGVTSPAFMSLAGPALEGTYVSNWVIPPGPEHEAFAKSFAALHGKGIVLDFVVGPTHDALTLVAKVVRRSENPREMRKLMSDEAPFRGISGEIKMDPDGAVRSILERIYVYRGGNLVVEDGGVHSQGR